MRCAGRLMLLAVVVAGCASSSRSPANASGATAASGTGAAGTVADTTILTAAPAVNSSAATTLAGATSGAPPAASAGPGEWLSFDGDLDHRGRVAAGPDPTSVSVRWRSPALDGDVYGQALVHNDTVFVATEGDSVVSMSASDGHLIWTTNLGRPVAQSTLPCGNIDPTGITSTPVIDAAGTTLYVVTFTQPGQHQLVAVDVASGTVRWRHAIDPPGLNPLVEQQRSALALANGRVYVAFGGLYGDCGPYKGAVVSFAADGSGDTSSWIVPTAREGGIWAPSGLAIDAAGNLYAATGNAASTDNNHFDYGNAVVRLTPDLKLADYWASTDWAALSSSDSDLGSQGPLLIGDNRVFVAGKAGIGYVLDATNLGHIGGEVSHLPICDRAFGASATDGTSLVVACENGVSAVTVASDGTMHAVWKAGGDRGGPPVIAGETVWISAANGHTRALDLASGHLLADVSVASKLNGFPGTTVTPNAIYVTGTNVVTMIA